MRPFSYWDYTYAETDKFDNTSINMMLVSDHIHVAKSVPEGGARGATRVEVSSETQSQNSERKKYKISQTFVRGPAGGRTLTPTNRVVTVTANINHYDINKPAAEDGEPLSEAHVTLPELMFRWNQMHWWLLHLC